MTTDDTQSDEVTPPTADEEPKPKAAAKRSKPKKAAARRAPRTRGPADVEFRFTGDQNVAIAGVPARDLSQADVDRIVYRRTIPEPGARGLRRGESGFAQARVKVVREVMATGKFTKRS